jgi:hypothetical protein
MRLKEAQELMKELHELGISTWVAQSSDGYILHMILNGEIIGVFRTDKILYGKN